MINVNYFFSFLKKSKVNFFSGVPDSILKETKTIFERMPDKNHVAAINEGVATSVCIGNHLATGNLPCVYLQNSGLGNAINPLISIAHKQVYSVPLLLLIGWRGAPGQKDEPQHLIKGKITKKLLNNLNIKFCQLKNNRDLTKLRKLINYSKKNKKPIACLVKKGVFYNPKKIKKDIQEKGISREIFIKRLLECIKKNTKIVSSTGYISRELHQIRKEKKISAGKDFYMVGGMGHANSVATGISLNNNNQVICLDGDGSLLMHFGSLHTSGMINRKNYKHILLNNHSHESVGCQKIDFKKVNMEKLIKGFGYKKFITINNLKELKKKMKKFIKSKGPSFAEVKIKTGSLENLKRPKNFIEIKKNFLKKL